MCGRFALSAYAGEIENLVSGIKIDNEVLKRYNIAPSQNIYGVINTGQIELAALRWGLIPSWAKDESIGHRIINARSDTVREKPAFRQLIRRRRCLVPATGYYEWQRVPGERTKQPYYIKVKQEKIITFAGLWDEWSSPAGLVIRSAAIITCPASDEIAFIHDRMPVIVGKCDREQWLDMESPQSTLIKMLKPTENNKLEYYTVSKAVNNPAFDDISCTRKAD